MQEDRITARVYRRVGGKPARQGNREFDIAFVQRVLHTCKLERKRTLAIIDGGGEKTASVDLMTWFNGVYCQS